jgi:xylulokinase
MKYVLTIDLGTSGPKVAIYSMAGEIVAHTKTLTAVILFPNGGAEQDPDEWWQAIKTAVAQVLAQDAVSVSDIVAVSCTSQWSGTVAVDQQGQPLMNAINWMDARGAGYVRQITGGPIKVEGYGLDKLLPWLRLTGGLPTLSGKDPIAHILYIKHELPDIYAQTYKFLEPKDYLNLRLTGKFAATYDSITLHWLTDNRDLTAVTYDDHLLKLAGVTREKLPDLIRATDVLGSIRPEVAAELGLETAVQVVGGTPDVHSAAIGSGAVADYEAHLSIGTSSWIIGHVPFKKTDIFHNMASLPSAIPERYLLINEQESAGACLNYLIDEVFYPDDKLATGSRPLDVYQRLNDAAATVPAGSGGLIFTPWLYGERTPVEDHAIRGSFFNLSLTTDRAHLVRAVFEGVAYNSKWLLGYVEKFMKRPLPELRAIGGGAQSALWCQIMADVLDRTIHQVENPMQANTRGVALLAAVALGYLDVADIGGTVQIANTYTPNPEHRHTYDEQFQTFLKLYKQHSKLLKK